jgi:hypothetical protein
MNEVIQRLHALQARLYESAECKSCGKEFNPFPDNEREDATGKSIRICDRCLSLGWPWRRNR